MGAVLLVVGLWLLAALILGVAFCRFCNHVKFLEEDEARYDLEHPQA